MGRRGGEGVQKYKKHKMSLAQLPSTGSITPNNVHFIGQDRGLPMQGMMFSHPHKANASGVLLNVPPTSLIETQNNAFSTQNKHVDMVAQDRSNSGQGLHHTIEDINPVRRRVGMTDTAARLLHPDISIRAQNPAPS